MINLNHPHLRMNILNGEKILVSPQRNIRPWQGQVEDISNTPLAHYDENCYLCPTNERSNGTINPDYKDSFVFVNDFSALLPSEETGSYNNNDLLKAEAEKGICKVIAFSPRHDLTLPEMEIVDIKKVIDVWQSEFLELSKTQWIKYIQIFENKGAIMGCSNPHPHGQIWAQHTLPTEIEKETIQFRKHLSKTGTSLLADYWRLEEKEKTRVIINNEHFIVVVPFWAAWPFETLVISKNHRQDISQFTEEEKVDLAKTLQELTIRYDNIFQTSFPYSAGMHQAPVNGESHPEWHWHMHFYPPLLRSASIKKFMVGYEMLATPQRDITAESAAEVIRNQSTIHYKQMNND